MWRALRQSLRLSRAARLPDHHAGLVLGWDAVLKGTALRSVLINHPLHACRACF